MKRNNNRRWKMHYEIGDVIDLKSSKVIVSVATKKGTSRSDACEGCIFLTEAHWGSLNRSVKMCLKANRKLGTCRAEERADGEDVIFTLVKEDK